MTAREDGPISDAAIHDLALEEGIFGQDGPSADDAVAFARALLRREGERLLQLIDNLLDAETAIDSVDGKRAICRMLGVEEKS